MAKKHSCLVLYNLLWGEKRLSKRTLGEHYCMVDQVCFNIWFLLLHFFFYVLQNSSRTSQSRSSTGNIPRTNTGSSLKTLQVAPKPSGAKSPMLRNAATPSGVNAPHNRPLTQNTQRSTPSNNHRSTPALTKSNVSRQTSKSNPAKK